MFQLCPWQCLLCFNNPFSYSATGNFFPLRLNEEMISGEALKQSRNGWLRGQDGSPSCQLNTTGMDWKDKSGFWNKESFDSITKILQELPKKKTFGVVHIHKSPPTTPSINIHHLPKGTTLNTTLRFFYLQGGNLPSPFMDILPRIFDQGT